MFIIWRNKTRKSQVKLRVIIIIIVVVVIILDVTRYILCLKKIDYKAVNSNEPVK